MVREVCGFCLAPYDSKGLCDCAYDDKASDNWVSLTDGELEDLWDQSPTPADFARLIEAALRRKNT